MKKFVDKFDNHIFVLILNPKIFISKVAKVLTDLGRSPKGCIVNYYPSDSILKENLTDFDKKEKYSYQNEYRLLYHDSNPRMQIIKVGSLSDIIFEMDQYNPFYSGNFSGLNLTIEMDSDTENKNTTA